MNTNIKINWFPSFYKAQSKRVLIWSPIFIKNHDTVMIYKLKCHSNKGYTILEYLITVDKTCLQSNVPYRNREVVQFFECKCKCIKVKYLYHIITRELKCF